VKVDKDETKDEVHETETFSSNANWKTVEKTDGLSSNGMSLNTFTT